MSPSAPSPAVHVDRYGLEVLRHAECLELLVAQPVGRIALLRDGIPTILPVTHAMVGPTVAFRTREGSKLDAAIMGRPVAFEVDGFDAEARTGWSVVVRGVVRVVDDADRLAHLEGLDLVPWSPAAADGRWVAILPDEITGRRIRPGAEFSQS